MDTAEIGEHLHALISAMAAKGIVRPDAIYSQQSSGRVFIQVMTQNWPDKPFDGNGSTAFWGAGIGEAHAAAVAYIAAMPDPETLVMHTYLTKLADAVDYGHSNGIAAEYVDPVRITQKTMSENLIGVAK